MAREKIPFVVNGVDALTKRLRAASGATVTLTLRSDDSPVAIYGTSVGGSPLSPCLVDDYGRIPGYAERPTGGTTKQVWVNVTGGVGVGIIDHRIEWDIPPDGVQVLAEKGQPDGYPPLDGAGKVPSTYLPASAMEWKGTWDASTNSPTLVDGTGNAGDTYRVSVAADRDLGGGTQAFKVGDLVIYNGSDWERNPDELGATLSEYERENDESVALLRMDGDDLDEAVRGIGGELWRPPIYSESFEQGVGNFNQFNIGDTTGNIHTNDTGWAGDGLRSLHVKAIGAAPGATQFTYQDPKIDLVPGKLYTLRTKMNVISKPTVGQTIWLNFYDDADVFGAQVVGWVVAGTGVQESEGADGEIVMCFTVASWVARLSLGIGNFASIGNGETCEFRIDSIEIREGAPQGFDFSPRAAVLREAYADKPDGLLADLPTFDSGQERFVENYFGAGVRNDLTAPRIIDGAVSDLVVAEDYAEIGYKWFEWGVLQHDVTKIGMRFRPSDFTTDNGGLVLLSLDDETPFSGYPAVDNAGIHFGVYTLGWSFTVVEDGLPSNLATPVGGYWIDENGDPMQLTPDQIYETAVIRDGDVAVILLPAKDASGSRIIVAQDPRIAQFSGRVAMFEGILKDPGLGAKMNAVEVWADDKPISVKSNAFFGDLDVALSGVEQIANKDTDTAMAANSDTRYPSQKAVKTYIDGRFGAVDAIELKGTTDASGNPNYPAADAGHLYRVSVAGRIGGGAGPKVQVGDTLLCLTDGSAAGTHAAVGANWNISQANIDGAVIGPAASTDNDVVTMDGASGVLVKDSGKAHSTDGTFGSNSDAKIPTEKAVKTYADTKQAALGYTAENAANKDTDGTLAANSDTKYPSQKAVKTYADQLIAAADAMVFKGVQDCSGNPNYPAANRGDTYRVSVAGRIGGVAGVVVEVGDVFLCLTDGTASGNQATVGANWSIAQTNIDGAVVGPVSAVSANLPTFNGVTGKIIQDSGVAISTDGAFASNSDAKTPTEKATVTYVATQAGLLIPKSLGTTKGDQIGFTGSGTPVRHAIGANDTFQIADSAQADGWKWAGLPTSVVDAIMPWNVVHPAIAVPDSNTNFGAPAQLYTQFWAGYRVSSGAVNDKIGWNFLLAAGTWEVTVFGRKSSGSGIWTVFVDTVSTTKTGDMYAASDADGSAITAATFVVAASGKHLVELRMDTKNVASAGYYLLLNGISLRRTA